MSQPARGERDLGRLLATMAPELDPARYAFCRAGEGALPARLTARAVIQEREGITLILEQDEALRNGLVPEFIARRIELTVHSDLHAVGFLARVTQELAAAGIPANPVSAISHDHLYVPEELAEPALAVLLALQSSAPATGERVMYAVTVRVDGAIADEWLRWMRAVHIPEVLATGCFSRCSIQREESGSGDDRITYLLEYLAHSAEALQRYQKEHAPALQQIHSRRYEGRFTASRAIRTVLAEASASLA